MYIHVYTLILTGYSLDKNFALTNESLDLIEPLEITEDWLTPEVVLSKKNVYHKWSFKILEENGCLDHLS